MTKVVAFIPARGGSRGIIRKNCQLLGDKPLLAWPISTAKHVDVIDDIVVSTDCDEIKDLATQWGASPIHRKAEHATDKALVIDAVKDYLFNAKENGDSIDILVLLEATSPFRTPQLVTRCIERLSNEKLDSIATFEEAELCPSRLWRLNDNAMQPFFSESDPWQPRQKQAKAFKLNGAVYAFNVHALRYDTPSVLFGNVGYEITKEKCIDIDEPDDLEYARWILTNKECHETV